MPRLVALLRTLLILATLLPGVAFSATTGAIRGKTVDDQGLSVPGVLITVTSDNMMDKRQAETDAEGRFYFIELPPGTYQVQAEAAGFSKIKKVGIPVNIGRTADLTIEMPLETAGEELVVEEARSVIDTESANRGTVLTKDFLQRIPAGRSYQSAVQMAAGVSGGSNPNVAGSASNENTYMLDGVNITDPVTGTFSLNFNFDAIEQIEVLTSAFDPEYSNLGGTINIVTETGGNNFEFKTGMYVTNGDWSPRQEARYAADGTFLAPTDFESTFQSYQFGMKISGPIIRDKAWFVASYQTERSLISTAGVDTPRDYEGHYVLAKLTVQPSTEHRFTLFTQTDPTTIDNIEASDRFVLPEAQGRQSQGGYVVSLQWDWFISPNSFLETKANVQKTFIERYGVPCTHNEDIGYNPCQPEELENSLDLETPARLGSNNAYNSDNYIIFDYDDRWRGHAQTRFKLLQVEGAGTHDFTFGADADLLVWNKTFGITGNHYYVDWNQQAFNPDTFSNYYWVEYSDPFNYVTSSEVYSGFFQDVYKPVDNFTLRYGTRYDRQFFRNDVGDVIINTGLWGPRLSAIWDPWGDNKTKVSGSIGRFNETGRLGVADYLSQANVGSKLYLGEVFGGFASDANNDFDYAPIANTNSVLEKLTQPRADIFSVGAEREIVRDLAAQMYFTGKYTRNLYAFDELNLIWDQDGYNLVGTTDGTLVDYYRMRTPVIARRDYYRFDASLLKVYSDRWEMQGTYSYSISRGTTQSGPTGILQVSPQVPYYLDGLLPTDIRHSVKLGASWDIPNDPWTTQLGMVVFYESGYPLSRGYSGGYAGTSVLWATRGTYTRTEPWMDVNLRMEQKFPVRKGALSGIVEFQNAFNIRQGEFAGISFDNRWVITGRNNPTRITLGAEYEF
jgi:hypothetical protein